MKKLFMCKVCGYVIKGEEPLEVCPACGARGKIFDEYTSPINEKRRRVLALHIHPVMVHFSLAFVLTMLLINLAVILDIFPQQSGFTGMIEAMVWLLPFAAVVATGSGMFDGKVRFKRINTPVLKRKLLLSILFIILSASLLLLQAFLDLSPDAYSVVILIFSLVLSGIGTSLGLIGGKLIEAKMRG